MPTIEEFVGRAATGQQAVYTNVLNLPRKLAAVNKTKFAEVQFAKLKVPLRRFKAMLSAQK